MALSATLTATRRPHSFTEPALPALPCSAPPQSTYCQTIQEHCAASGRSVHVINLDPAAEAFKYQIDADVRDLISVDEVMDELGMGPNGGLLYCMEYLAESIEWFQEILRNFGEDDYVLLDCPGQIELYSHIPVMRRVVDVLRSEGEQCGPASARGRAGGGLLCRVESRAGRDVVDGGQARGADAQRHFPLETAPGKGGGGSLCFAAPPRLLQCAHWPPSATRTLAAFAARLIRAARPTRPDHQREQDSTSPASIPSTPCS